MIENIPAGSRLAFSSFMPSETGYADIAPGEELIRSERAAIGQAGSDLVLTLLQRRKKK